VRQAFELYALLIGWASRHVANRRNPWTIAALSEALPRIQRADDPDVLELEARNFRRIVNLSVAGPHLKALLRTFWGLVPLATQLAMPQLMDKVAPMFEEEFEAVRDGDGARAEVIATANARLMGITATEILRQRGVIPADDPPAPWTTGQLPLPEFLMAHRSGEEV
jgi:DNA-binding GntR family transcriptional regulator